MSTEEAQATLKVIRWSLISTTSVVLCALLVVGAVVIQQRLTSHPIQLDLTTADTEAKVCINGFSYKLTPSDPDPQFGGGVEILELETEPKGEIPFSQNGIVHARRSGPKACSSKG
jgi:hypothetical protein